MDSDSDQRFCTSLALSLVQFRPFRFLWFSLDYIDDLSMTVDC